MRSGASEVTKNRELCKSPDAVSDIKRRLERLGHMLRIDQIKITKKLLKLAEKYNKSGKTQNEME